MENHRTSDTLSSLLRGGSLYHRAPPYLRVGVLADLYPEPRTRRPFAWVGVALAGVPGWVNAGFAGIGLCALALSAVLMLQRPDRTGDIAQEIVSSHVRGLLSQRSMDVISTDQHTVKPWFSGRLDYAPPVIDPAARGFPLVGGRIDYVAHRPIAVLIYRYQKHSIDLYVFPDSTRGVADSATSADGYSLARWHWNSMTYWAISDASPANLHAFEEAMLAETHRQEAESREPLRSPMND